MYEGGFLYKKGDYWQQPWVNFSLWELVFTETHLTIKNDVTRIFLFREKSRCIFSGAALTAPLYAYCFCCYFPASWVLGIGTSRRR